VVLPPGGSETAITATDPDGAKAQYGPAVISGGLWPCEDVGTDPDGDGVTGNCPSSAPASGPQAASTQGTPGGGTVKSSADIALLAEPVPVTCFPDWGPNPPSTDGCVSYGGSGPFPVQADSVHVECTATADSVTGSTTFKNAILATTTDVEGNPVDQEVVPDSPPVNYTRSGVITNVGDVFTAVYNQQIVNADGSLTVNAVHMYLFGPTAVGEVVRGQATCGVTPSTVATADTIAPSCGIPVIAPEGPEDPTPKVPADVLVGLFDAGNGGDNTGITSITPPQVTNGEATIGTPDGAAYLKFVPGSGTTKAVIVHAVRVDEDQPMSFSFTVTDKAGNTRNVTVDVANVDGKAVATSSECPTDSPQGAVIPIGTSTGGAGSGSGSDAAGTGGGGSGTGSSGSGTGAAGVLGKTGIEVLRFVLVGGLLIGAGTIMVRSSRSRRRTKATTQQQLH
jgi:hypothetical protein